MRIGNWRGPGLAIALVIGLTTEASAGLTDAFPWIHTIPRVTYARDLRTGGLYYAPPVPYGHYAKDPLGHAAGVLHGAKYGLKGHLHGLGSGLHGGHHLGTLCGSCNGAGCDLCGGDGLLESGHGLGLGGGHEGSGAGHGITHGGGLLGHGGLFGHKDRGIHRSGHVDRHAGQGCVGPKCELEHNGSLGHGHHGAFGSSQGGPFVTGSAQAGHPGHHAEKHKGPGPGGLFGHLFDKGGHASTVCPDHGKAGCGFLGRGHGYGGTGIPCGSCGGAGCGLCGGDGLLDPGIGGGHGHGHGLGLGDGVCANCGGAGCALCGGKGHLKGSLHGLLGRLHGLHPANKVRYFVGAGGPVPLTPGYVPYINPTRSPRDFFAFPPYVDRAFE